MWRLLRIGDVAVSWTCGDHITEVALELQRDQEITELNVINSPKAREWGEIGRALDKIANEGKQRCFICGHVLHGTLSLVLSPVAM